MVAASVFVTLRLPIRLLSFDTALDDGAWISALLADARTSDCPRPSYHRPALAPVGLTVSRAVAASVDVAPYGMEGARDARASISAEWPQRVLDQYFDDMGNGDVAGILVNEATWTITDAGAVVRGMVAVRDHVTALHGHMVDRQTRGLAVADGGAHVTGDYLAGPDASARTASRVAYHAEGNRSPTEAMAPGRRSL
jgi:hypothetical protein